MPESRVIMDVRAGAGSSSVIDVHGQIDASAEHSLMDAYDNATEAGSKTVVLNFDDLEYMDSRGIGLLVRLLVRANRQGQRVLASGLNDHYREVFEVTRLDEVIRVYPTESEALETLRAA